MTKHYSLALQWVYFACLLLLTIGSWAFSQYLPLSLFDENSWVENLQNAILIYGLVSCWHTAHNQQNPSEKHLWFGMVLIFCLLIARELNAFRGMLYAENSILWGLSNRVYSQLAMFAVGLLVLYLFHHNHIERLIHRQPLP